MTIHSTFWERVLTAYRQRRLYQAIYLRIIRIIYAVRNTASGRVSLHAPDYIEPDKDEMEIAERIYRSFGKMKQDQRKAPEYYLPSSMWQAQLDDAYSYLNSALKENNLCKFHYFLANFGAWKNYLGISEDSVFIRNSMKSFMKRRYAESGVYYNLLKVWQWFYNDRKPISCLSYPTYGNQAGAYINDVFVGIDSFFSEIYGSLLSGLICDIKHPVVAELGAGHGRLAHFILRNIDDFTFIDYDLPETVCLAAYYLMKVYPDKRTLLYGEEDYSLRRHKEYDLIFMPSYEISKIGECPVDLFLNENSLGEMTKETATNYIAHITGATRGYFFHRNHDTNPIIYSNNECGLLGYEYPIPIDKFNLLFRYPDMHHMLYKGFLDWSLDIFTYLYKRKNSSEPKDTN